MPVGQRPRPVNTFGNLPGELYLPAQRGNLTVTVILRNNGPIAVTIESVSIDPSLALAGKPLYRKALLTPNKLLSATRGPVSGLVLQPGETVVVGLPLHVPACVNRDSTPYVMADSFTVTDRFFGFTHRGAIPLAIPLIWLPAFQAGTPGTVCAR
jgi:hypothetical protein